MSILTSITRAWLTRSMQPFTFTADYDRALDYDGEESLGLYVHIPFCRTICDFCPYCKQTYDRAVCGAYIDRLIAEIHLVCAGHPRRTATSLYFGGGSPALAADRLGEIIAALRAHFDITDGIGVELHPADVTVPVLTRLRDAGVTRICVGVQSFLPKFQQLLGRAPVDAQALKAALSAVPFETVSMDFIFALPGQTIDDLAADLEAALDAGANHVAVYPFIDFTFTQTRLKPMKKAARRRLLDALTDWCENRGLTRDSIWTFGTGGAKYSSMTRENFLGFGCSATTLLRGQFKVNTFDVDAYCGRIDAGELPTALTIRFTERQRMVYWLFWTAYSTRVDARDFERFFGKPLMRMYGAELALAKALGFVREADGVVSMTKKGAFYYHYYERFYTLAYIDKMWSLLRHTPFPEGMTL